MVRTAGVIFLASLINVAPFALGNTLSLYPALLLSHESGRPQSKLHFEYSVRCDPNARESFPGIIGEGTFSGRTFRFYLFKYQTSQDLDIGSNTNQTDLLNEVYFHFLPSKNCKLLNLVLSVLSENETFTPPAKSENISEVIANHSFIHTLAQEHAPYLILRPDQIAIADRDVPLGIAYSVIPATFGFSLRYTYFFSNETVSGLFATTKAKSLGSWGRRCDIEWIYQVDFDPSGNVRNRIYQGGILFGIGHRTHHFNGDYLPGTERPILYDIAKHNVFGTRPAFGNYVYRHIGIPLIAEEEITAPHAREIWLWHRPWTFDVTDRELNRDGKLAHASNEYLYVNLNGSLAGGKIRLQAKNADGNLILAGDGAATIKKLGEDLFGQETFSAIRLDPDSLKSGGIIHIKRSTRKTSLQIPKFYSLIKDPENGFLAKDISDRFSCQTPFDCVY